MQTYSFGTPANRLPTHPTQPTPSCCTDPPPKPKWLSSSELRPFAPCFSDILDASSPFQAPEWTSKMQSTRKVAPFYNRAANSETPMTCPPSFKTTNVGRRKRRSKDRYGTINLNPWRFKLLLNKYPNWKKTANLLQIVLVILGSRKERRYQTTI